MTKKSKEQAVVGSFTARRVGTKGCEILDSDGRAVAWAIDEVLAVQIVSLLNLANAAGLV